MRLVIKLDEFFGDIPQITVICVALLAAVNLVIFAMIQACWSLALDMYWTAIFGGAHRSFLGRLLFGTLQIPYG